MADRNMYNCLPCPKCSSEFRYLADGRAITCDDCGFREDITNDPGLVDVMFENYRDEQLRGLKRNMRP